MSTFSETRCSDNEFGLFPLCRTWRSICEHVERWDRAEAVQLLADRYETLLLFHCDGHEFCAYDEEAMLHLCEDGECPSPLLNEVRGHFAAFLPSKPWGSAAQFGMFGD